MAVTDRGRNDVRPFVKWVGGKRQLIPKFRSLGLFPPIGFDDSIAMYHEPFVGGGAAFFNLLPSSAVLSDRNSELILAYTIARDDVESLITELCRGLYIYDRERYYEIRSLPQHKQLTKLEIAARFIYLNRTGFNGLYRVNRQGHFNVPFGKYVEPKICDSQNLRMISTALRGSEIVHGDYADVLNRASAGDFVYFDPPYYPVSKTSSFTAYTADGFLEKEQRELMGVFKQLALRGVYVLQSNSYTDFILDLYNELRDVGIRMHTVEASRAINSNALGRGKISEVLISNYGAQR